MTTPTNTLEIAMNNSVHSHRHTVCKLVCDGITRFDLRSFQGFTNDQFNYENKQYQTAAGVSVAAMKEFGVVITAGELTASSVKRKKQLIVQLKRSENSMSFNGSSFDLDPLIVSEGGWTRDVYLRAAAIRLARPDVSVSLHLLLETRAFFINAQL